MNPAPQKIALITGAARRLGRAIALGMAADGWVFIVHYRPSRAEALDTASQLEKPGHRATGIECDLGEPSTTPAFCFRDQSILGAI